MDQLRAKIDELTKQRATVVNQDIDAYVDAKLKELAPTIRAEAEKAQAYETKVLDIRIDAFNEALAIVEAVKAVEPVAVEETEETDTEI